ncbi:uroporphyrinogen-III synthase [Alteromonas facilis]|uniref:uroporphyrinogen-III synthase n=1 Tax=Alteromonas facilis TaxID=2048004 RepID=UPI000C28911B|nr:uroporphyrinogen-III synthase [Alteromonas facilis]
MMLVLIRPLQTLSDSLAQFERAGLPLACQGIALQDICVSEEGKLTLTNSLSESIKPVDVMIVTSQHAADVLVPIFRHLPPKLLPKTIIAIGDKTRAAMAEYAPFCVVPDEHTSEGVLSMSELNAPEQQRVVIVKGQGGRTTMHDELTQRGAWVEQFNVYQRNMLPISEPVTQAIQAANMLVVTSGEVVEHILELIQPTLLSAIQWIVPSQRIANILIQHGLNSVHISAGASDSALLKCVHQITE